MKESPVSSDSLLTIDLKSGPKVTLGTHVITLEKFFKGTSYNTEVFCYTVPVINIATFPLIWEEVAFIWKVTGKAVAIFMTGTVYSRHEYIN